MKSAPKTNAMRMLDKQKIVYKEYAYDIDDGLIDGHSVYKKLGMDPASFFKTLVTRGKDKQIFVFVIPVLEELDLKKAAKSVNEKNVEMLPVKELLAITGYVRGGCSPVGMKKLYTTVFDKSIDGLDEIFVSGGRKGLLMRLQPDDLLKVTEGKTEEITLVS
ncbi:MAG: Cys-tRNA(Pro) deacylase [Pseudopedobacter saltans]|uniref:Cys-tRNA(Pro)/Cys-tRNA(Cys) deacylase n=1 Tax=Pseudopedobacter saltans TaxID=151895 RepID=A0A2W5H6B1_9SPHI|nr:MAG: Cys-tRNA(Pro) deacylase [Pseudopedobacter saltans]